MSLLAASRLSLAYGPKVLLDQAGFSVGPHDRIGLVGANGTGKSSLMRILAGQVSPDDGELVFRRGARVGYLPQDVAALPDLPLVDSVLATVPGRASLEERLHAAEAALSAAREPADQLELSQALAELHEELEHFEEHYGRRRAERILGGLGFTADDLGPAGAHLLGRLEDAGGAVRASCSRTRTCSSSTSPPTTSTSPRSPGSTRSCAARARRSCWSRTTASS